MEEVQPEQTREIITKDLIWHVLLEGKLDSKPIGLMGYNLNTNGKNHNILYIEFLYIDKKYRKRPRLWFSKIIEFCREWGYNDVEIQANQKTSKWVERLAKKKPSVLIYQLKTDEVGDQYGW
jgi:GNAT superfamily N-acetyltransferase